MAEFNDLLSPDEALIPVSEELLNLTINIFDRSDEFMVRNQFRFVNGLTASLIKFSEMLTNRLGNNPFLEYYEIAVSVSERRAMSKELMKDLRIFKNGIRFFKQEEAAEFLLKIAKIPNP
ncbi:hypothetical protein [Leptospira santarosai]|nr:hypothetical protein [Leptospira santarosai]MDI7165307.1 hypothetical protein [Leptospira santarosai]